VLHSQDAGEKFLEGDGSKDPAVVHEIRNSNISQENNLSQE
jgi:hypothetical protein